MLELHRHNRTALQELLVDETIFCVANGYVGTRGTFAEGYGTGGDYHQTYLNGFYDYYDYHYEENLSGFPQQGQKFVNLPDGTKVTFTVDGTLLDLTHATLTSLDRTYDLASGVTTRVATYRTKRRTIRLTERRIVPRQAKFLIVLELRLETDDPATRVQIESHLGESRRNKLGSKDPRLHDADTRHLDILDVDVDKQAIHARTSLSGLHVLSTMRHDMPMAVTRIDNRLIARTDVTIGPDEPLSFTKYICHTASLYDSAYESRGHELIEHFSQFSFAELCREETAANRRFWRSSYIELPGNKELEERINYNLFMLDRQGGEDHRHNISAKGLSGEGYEGHYFWDTEIYMIPFFTLTNPAKAKQLLLYRCHTLPAARQEAINLGYKQGAKIPWRTINGHETSPYYPAGSAQFHINSDVAYAVIKYVEATGDTTFLIEHGFELMLETARFLAEAVNEVDGTFHLNGVTGPDEYTTIVDDNYYTNAMLQYHFRQLAAFYKDHREALQTLTTEDEIALFETIADNIHLPVDEALGIVAQDRTFLTKKRLDLSTIPRTQFPLLLHFHPLYLYKHQVLKQADAMLAMMLLDDADTARIERSFDYYEPITTHDSSLSKCIYSILACRIGRMELASEYLDQVLRTDLDNVHHNTKDGLHVANLGGSYLGFVHGLVGLRIHHDRLKLAPRVTHDIQSYTVRLSYRGNAIEVRVADRLTITTEAPVSLEIYGTRRMVDGTYQTDLSE